MLPYSVNKFRVVWKDYYTGYLVNGVLTYVLGRKEENYARNVLLLL